MRQKVADEMLIVSSVASAVMCAKESIKMNCEDFSCRSQHCHLLMIGMDRT